MGMNVLQGEWATYVDEFQAMEMFVARSEHYFSLASSSEKGQVGEIAGQGTNRVHLIHF